MILQVDVHQVGRKRLERFQTVGLSADQQIDWLINQPEIAAVDLLQQRDRRLDLFKERRRMALVGQPNSSYRGQVGGSFGRFNVRLALEADTDQIAAERLGHIQTGADVAQTIRTMLVVERYVGVRRHHRNDETGALDLVTHSREFLTRSAHAAGAGPHAYCTVTVLGRERNDVREGSVETSLAGRLGYADGKGQFHRCQSLGTIGNKCARTPQSSSSPRPSMALIASDRRS